jgi:hypothetical protein
MNGHIAGLSNWGDEVEMRLFADQDPTRFGCTTLDLGTGAQRCAAVVRWYLPSKNVTGFRGSERISESEF